MRKHTTRLLGILLSLIMLLVLIPAAVMAEEPEVKTIYLIHTNDVHGRVIGDSAPGSDGMPVTSGIIGYARLKAFIDTFTAAHEGQVLVIDAGDTIHGTNFATLSKGQSVVRLMNDIGYDLMVPGNHDFNYGYEELKIVATEADFPIMASNVVFEEDGSAVFETGAIFEVDGIKLGIFGMSTPETKVKSSPINTEGLDFVDPAELAGDEIAALTEAGSNAVIMVGHIGIDEESEITTTYIIDNVDGIDVAIDGHSHTVLEEGMLYGDTLIAQTGSYLSNIGLVTLTFTDGELTDKSAELIPFVEAAQYGEDEELLASVAAIEVENERFTEVEVAESASDLEGERDDVRAGETNLSDLITDAMLWATDADVVITNGGGIRASIPAGMITMGDLLTVLPFGNMVTVIEVTGQDLLDALDFGVDAYPNTAGKFPQVAGLTYTVHMEDDVAHAVDVLFNGEALDPDATYKLATNDFMAIGGDGYTMFEGANQVLLEGLMVDVVRDYIEFLTEDGSLLDYEADNRITFEE